MLARMPLSLFKYFVILLTFFLAACSTSPTGRNQFLMFSDQEINQLGNESFAQMKAQLPQSNDQKLNQYVQCVARAVTSTVDHANRPAQWEVVLFDSPEVNAFALPGGKIGVYTGLLNVANNQDQLATVIGHEVAHVLANHSNERMSRGQLADYGMQVSDLFISSSDYAEHKNLAMAALGLGVQVGVILPYGRQQESEADMLGLELMAKAGFKPQQSVVLWQNMAKNTEGAGYELLSTHPSHTTRIQDLTNKITQLPTYSAPRPQCQG